MPAESIFQMAFWVLCGGGIVMHVDFAARIQRAGERFGAYRNAIERQGWGYIVARIIRYLALVIFLVLYVINPPWFGMLLLPFPEWLRWVGILLGLGSFILYTWAQDVLGKAWSPHLQMRQQHLFITSGPYVCIRHPIYTAYLIFMTGIALLTANWFFIGLLAVSIVVFALRIPKEEMMLIEAFGAQYAEYIRRTGGLLPKF